jgi:hypothetical protein
VQYALLIYVPPAQTRERLGGLASDGCVTWAECLSTALDSGALLVAEELLRADVATTVRRCGEDLVLTDGPYADTAEQLLGLLVIDVPDLDAAIAWAARMPVLGRGTVEIRPVRPALSVARPPTPTRLGVGR